MEEIQKLKLKRPNLRNGENRVFRKGKVLKYKKGAFVDLVDFIDDKKLARARIIDFQYKMYKNLQDVDIINACERSFRSQGDLFNELGLNSYNDFVTTIILETSSS